MAIKSELEFGFNNFGKQKYMDEKETIAQMILNLFLLRPGQLPSMPHIGINIQKYLYHFESDVSSEDIRTSILTQCPTLGNYIDLSLINVVLVPYENESLLYIGIPILATVDGGGSVIYGFKKTNDNNIVTFNYKVSDEQLF